MAKIARKSDGRRIFTEAFKRQQIERVWRGEISVTALSRKLGIARSLLHRWKRSMPNEGAMSGPSDRRSPPLSRLGAAQYIRELQTLVGKQSVELELLRVELETYRRGRRPPRGTSR